jgi:putative hydrolase of the HAD superfamily
VKAVIFDLYETLITEFDPNWVRLPSVAERLGLDEISFAAEWKATWHNRMTGVLPDYPHALREICVRLKREPDEAIIYELMQERQAVKARCFSRIEDDVVQVLRHLQHSSIRLGLLSNAAAEQVTAWHNCALSPFFDAVVFSFEVGLVKPDERIYQLACQQLGVAPAQTIYVGDGGDSELTGAARAGLTPYWATWFLDRWPAWKRSPAARAEAGRYPRVRSPQELVQMVQDKVC